jgi:hypothetical protein
MFKKNMKKIGKRKEPILTGHPTAENLIRGAKMNEAMQKLPTGDTNFVPRGKVYRFKTLLEANQFDEECIRSGIVKILQKKT